MSLRAMRRIAGVRRFVMISSGEWIWPLLCVPIVSTLAGCSEDRSQGPTVTAPTIEIAFPFAHARYYGETISVSGVLDHPDLEKASISASAGGDEVQGQIAANGSFVIPDVPIEGDEAFSLIVIAKYPGVSRRTRMRLSREPELTDVPAMVLHPDRERVILVDRFTASVLAAPLDGSARTLLSGDRMGSGPTLRAPVAIALDASGDVAYVADEELDAVFAVELASGERTIVSDSTVGSGPMLFTPKDIDFDVERGVLVLTDEFRGLVAIEPATGARRLVSDSTSAGPVAGAYRGIAVDQSGDRYLVSNGQALFAVDPDSGARSMLSDWITDPSFGRLFRGMSMPSGGSVYIADEMSDGVVKIDLATGSREQVTSSGLPAPWSFPVVGQGPSLQYPNDVVFDAEDSRLFLVEGEYADPLIQVAENGDRSILRDGGLGTGLHFRSPSGLKFDATEGTLIAADYIADTVVSIDLTTGDRTALTAPPDGRGTIEFDLVDAERDSTNGRYYVIDYQTDSLAVIDPQTGARTTISDSTTGTGVALENPTQVVIDGPGHTAYVATYSGAVIAVDLTSGARRLVGSYITAAVALDPARRHLYVADGQQGMLHRIDLVSGAQTSFGSFTTTGSVRIAYDGVRDRIIAVDDYSAVVFAYSLEERRTQMLSASLSETEIGSGLKLIWPRAVAVDAAKQIAFVADAAYGAIIAVDMVSGDRQLVSK